VAVGQETSEPAPPSFVSITRNVRSYPTGVTAAQIIENSVQVELVLLVEAVKV
jgi:hypothetical protein